MELMQNTGGPESHPVFFCATDSSGRNSAAARLSYWAVVSYQTGDESYGCDPAWPKKEPGGALPADLPLPALPGEPKGPPIRLREAV
jgi:hypothetical protein